MITALSGSNMQSIAMDRSQLPRHDKGNQFCKLIPESQESLLVMTRCPDQGRCKTRLAATLGEVLAIKIYVQLLTTTLRVVTDHRSRERNHKILFCGEAIQQLSCIVRSFSASTPLVPQCSGDLGDRLVSAFAEEFRCGQRSVVAIGTDCPDLTPRILDQAFRALTQHDVVVGPSQDGGFYLIGLAQHCPEIFQNIAWGTTDVLQQTLENATVASLSVGFLPELQDVDVVSDITLAMWCRMSS